MVSIFDAYGSVDGYLSCLVAILYFGTVYILERLGSGTLARTWFRGFLADYAYPVRSLFVPKYLKGVLPNHSKDCYSFLDWIFSHSWNH